MAYTKGRKLATRPRRVTDREMRAHIRELWRRLFGEHVPPPNERKRIALVARLSRTTVRDTSLAQRPRMSHMTVVKLAESAGFEIHLRRKKAKKTSRTSRASSTPP